MLHLRRTRHALCSLLFIASLWTQACADDDADAVVAEGSVDAALAATAPDSGVYANDRLLDVQLTLATADWDRIRNEGRSVNQVFSECVDPNFSYSYVEASAQIDGEAIAKVGLRKKGFLGSLSVVKPSLVVDFNELVANQSFRGHNSLTLNNSRSDASLIKQCLAYHVFELAGLPAPRCSFARVHVNGSDLGTYVNVEPIKKPLLRRYFQNVDGNLYEGNSGADFRADALAKFEKKTNESSADRSDLERVRAALESSGQPMLDQLELALDVEQYLRYWAVETLIGFWDGYSGDLNNFALYNDPTSGKFSFLPWGPDDTFATTHRFLPAGERPAATYAWARLPRRLYEYAPTRLRYHEMLRKLLDSVWSEPALLAKVDALAALLGPAVDQGQLTTVKTFISERRAAIESELAAPDVPWTIPERTATTCNPALNTAISGRFVATWGALDAPVANPENTLNVVLDGAPYAFASALGSAGSYVATGSSVSTPAVRLLGPQPDGSLVLLHLSVPVWPSAPGEVSLHGFETVGVVLAGSGSTFATLGYLGEGKIILEQVGNSAGAPVVGRLEAKFIQTRAYQTPSP